MREVPGFRRRSLHLILAPTCLFALSIYAFPAAAQSGSGNDQPQVQAPEKPFDPSSVEPTSLHTPAKEDVKHDTPGLTIKPGKMLHTDVAVPLVNVTVTNLYNRLSTGLEPNNFRAFEVNTEKKVPTFFSKNLPIPIAVFFDLT